MTQVATPARHAAHSSGMDALARFGLAARAIVYVLIGWLGFQIALGDSSHQANARGALAILRRDGAFDVLFTDIRLPGEVDGWELASEGKKLIPALKVIYATGLNDDTGRVSAGEKMLAKPYRKDDLLNALA